MKYWKWNLPIFKHTEYSLIISKWSGIYYYFCEYYLLYSYKYQFWKTFTYIIMAEARQLAGFKLAVKPDGKIEIDWSSGNSYNNWKYVKIILSIVLKLKRYI